MTTARLDPAVATDAGPARVQPAAYSSAPARPWLRLSIGAAALALIGSVISVVGAAGVYADLTDFFLPQALAQDVANIAIAAPVLAISAAIALRGSLLASIVWLGAIAFTVYNYVIYALSVPFGPLFPLWVSVLGLSVFAMIGGAMTIDGARAGTRFGGSRAITTTAWVLLIIAILFGGLWLSEDVPALLTGAAQQSSVDMNIPTNVVHVLDYAFFLPAAIMTAVTLLRRRPFAYAAAPAFLVFLILTCIPILITPAVQIVLGAAAGWTVMAPVGVLALVMTATLAWLFMSTPAAHRRAATRSR